MNVPVPERRFDPISHHVKVGKSLSCLECERLTERVCVCVCVCERVRDHQERQQNSREKKAGTNLLGFQKRPGQFDL